MSSKWVYCKDELPLIGSECIVEVTREFLNVSHLLPNLYRVWYVKQGFISPIHWSESSPSMVIDYKYIKRFKVVNLLED